MDNLKEIEIDNLFTELDSHVHAIIYYWSPSCGICRYIGPIFDNIAKEYPNVLFGKVNTRENVGTYSMLGIKGVPTLKFYEDGRTVDTIVGCKDYNTIKQTYIDKIEELING